MRSTGIRRLARSSLLLAWLTVTHTASLPAPAADSDAPDQALLEMIVDLLRETDRDLRALGWQQVREEVPGAAATQRFVELLPLLLPEAQAGLIEALGERGDPHARVAVVAALDSDHAPVRVAALRALGSLGGAGDIPRLATIAATGLDDEQRAAAQALLRLRGDDIHPAMVSVSESAQPGVRAQLLNALGARNATDTLPAVLQAARHSDLTVQTAALQALRQLAAPADTQQLVELLTGSRLNTAAAREHLLQILLTLASRGGETCVPALREGLEQTDESGQILLLQALARAGGPAARETLLAFLESQTPTVRLESLRLLANCSDPVLVPPLLEIARGEELRPHVLALRGLVRLADARDDRPADAKLLGQLWTAARRPEEQRLILAAYSRARGEETLTQLVSLLDDSHLTEEIAWAIVAVAERSDHSEAVGPALQRVLEVTQHAWARERAEQIIEEER